MTKEQLIREVLAYRPDLSRERIERFSKKTLNNILIVETAKDEQQIAEEAFIAQL